MKKSLFILLSVIISTPVFAKINVIVSIQPQMEFVKKIGGEHIKTTLMVLPGKSPHTYEPKPLQMIEVSNANLYLSIGVEFEKIWLPKFMAQNKNLILKDISKNINKSAMKHEHRHEEKNQENSKKANSLDPHIWVDPIYVKIIAKNIFEALRSMDRDNNDYYQENLDRYLKELDAVDREIRDILKETPKNSHFMVFHPSWGYFAKRYGLEQLAIEIEGKSPKPKEIIEILKEAKRENIKAIFTQPEFTDKSAHIIAKELNIKVIKTSPLSKEWSTNLINLAKAIAKGK